MKTLIKLFVLIIGILIYSCQSQPPIMIDNVKNYDIAIKKNDYTVHEDSVPISTMIWNKKGDNCEAIFEADKEKYCFQYKRKPDRQVLIKDVASEEIVATINNIKKFESNLTINNDGEYTLKPIKGNIVVLKNEMPVAKITVSKKKYKLEISEAYANNALLKSAILYKHSEYVKMSTSDSDMLLLIILLGAM